jgi:hypothetical protein
MPGGLHPPIEQWLEWPAPNYIDPPTRPPYVLIAACILGPASLATFLARLWVRLRIQKNPGWDDLLMLASWVEYFAMRQRNTADTSFAQFPVLALTVMYPLGKQNPTMCISPSRANVD